jgi:hypothetical protein
MNKGTIKGIQIDGDEVLEKAIDFLKNELQIGRNTE